MPPCLATLGFLSPSPVLRSHHRSQIAHTDGLSWPLLPRCASPVVAVLKRLGLDCLCFAVFGGRRGQLDCICFYINGGASLLSMCSPGAAFVEPHWPFWEQQP